jgi:hypothetical protein
MGQGPKSREPKAKRPKLLHRVSVWVIQEVGAQQQIVARKLLRQVRKRDGVGDGAIGGAIKRRIA